MYCLTMAISKRSLQNLVTLALFFHKSPFYELDFIFLGHQMMKIHHEKMLVTTSLLKNKIKYCNTYLAHILCFLGGGLETSLYVFNDKTFSGFFFVSMSFFQIHHKIKTCHNLITIQKGLSLYPNVLVTCNAEQIIKCASQQVQISIRLSPFIVSSSSFCTFRF